MIITFVSILRIVLRAISIVFPILVAVAYFTVAERKLLGAIQRRKGPNVVGFVGLLQPLADGLKLFTKETVLPSNSSAGVFLLAPVLTFLLSLLGWAVIPFSSHVVLADINLGVLYLLVISSINVYSILLAGWSSNSKYSFLGAIRSTAQIISYEISVSFVVVTICVCSGSLNLTHIVTAQKKIWFSFSLLPLNFIFSIAMLAETNRHPFDLPEAEAELVSGYNVEYSAMTFALFFLGEYANMLLMSSIISLLFFGGWFPIFKFLKFNSINFLLESVYFSTKILIGILFFVFTRASLPRYRYDQLMSIGWKCFLPFSITYLTLTIGTTISFQQLPV